MTRREITLFSVLLVLLGAGWGLTMPLTKIAVSTGYKHFGLLFWQLAIGTVVMAVIAIPLGIRLPWHRAALRLYLVIAMIGSVLPNTAGYQAAVHLPSGILSILLSMIPIFAFPIALALGLDRLEGRRMAGLVIGLAAVGLLVLPGADVSGEIPVFWLLVGLFSGLFYAFEGNYVAKWGTEGLNPLQVLWGASALGMLIALPLALFSGQWIDPRPPWGAPEIAQIASSSIHVIVYAAYVWLVAAAGPIFAVQVSYLVTLSGVFWAKLILDESYPLTVWAALALMLLGMYLVQPRRTGKVEAKRTMRDTVR